MAGATDSVVNVFLFDVVASVLVWGVYLLAAWMIQQITGFTYDRSMLMLLLAWMAEENWRRTRR